MIRLNKMRVRFSYLLMILLFTFIFLYLYDPIVSSRSFKDLWANLLAGVLAALLIDRIVKYSEREKLESSTKYVMQRLARICTSLVHNMAPAMQPTDYGYIKMSWENALKAEFNSQDWAWYYERIQKSRQNALDELRYVVNNQRELLSEKQQNDLFTLLETLEMSEWEWWLRDLRNDIWKLLNISILAATTANEAFRTLREDDLPLNLETRWSVDIGKRPQRIEAKINKKLLSDELKKYEELSNQTMKFRDAVQKVALPEIG
jgi:hypothetical protein